LDGKVKAADIEYKVPGESKFRSTTRPIHKLVLVVPVEEQTMEETEKLEGQERDGDKPEGDRNLAQGLGVKAGDGEESGGQAHEGEGWKENKGDPREPGDKEGVRDSEQFTEVKANNATCTEAQEKRAAEGEEEGVPPAKPSKVPNISYQDGAETMMDVGQAARKGRGRPRKEDPARVRGLKEAISPGPCKGSVTDKETRVCADPGGNGATMNERGEGGPGPPGRG
jgi:hypothetical protein